LDGFLIHSKAYLEMSEKLYPYKRNGRFYFDKNHKLESLVFGTIPTFISSIMKRKNGIPEVENAWVQHDVPAHKSDLPLITWIGHSTFLIQLNGINILTDPIFGNASFLYPRMVRPGLTVENLPPIHATLISHNHPDHMDTSSLMALKKRDSRMRMLVPLGDKKWFEKRGFLHTQEFEWEQVAEVSDGDSFKKVSCTFVPAYHWTRRGIFDGNKSLWGGWVIQSGSTSIYFAGDTAYSKPCFDRIKYLFPQLTVALMPIGPAEPRAWMRHAHVDAHEAGQAFLDVNAQHFIPMHWGTFAFGDDYFEAPLDSLKRWWRDNHSAVLSKQLHFIKAGQQFQIPVITGDMVPTEKPIRY
jgi:L-ascorbate metabolism protein UlaG (beta-lactamase superfamily)